MNISVIDSFSHLGYTFIIMSSTMKAAMSTLLDKYMLTGSNFIDWLRNLRIVICSESLLHVLEEPSLMNLQLMLLKNKLMPLINI